MKKLTISMNIIIDEDAGTAELRRSGCKLYESKVWSVTPSAIAGLWRTLADYAMEEAFDLEHYEDFCTPVYTNEERRKMALRVCEEHKNHHEQEDCA